MKRVTTHAALGLVLLLVLPAQAAQDSSEWEKDIRQFEASDRTNPPPKGAVLFVGSSSIRLWTNLTEHFPSLTTIRRGFGGSRLSDCLYFADRIITPYRPAKIVVYAGENDIARGESPEKVFENFCQLAHKVRKDLPGTSIYFISMKPSPSRWHLSPHIRKGNKLIQTYCNWHRRTRFIDVWSLMLTAGGQPDPKLFVSDNLHLNQTGYKLWAAEIAKALRN